MDTMSALDSAFLEIEDAHSALHIGSIGVFEGPVPPFAEVREEIVRKLHRVPRYRQRMLRVPGSLGRPVWRDDPDFDVDHHLHHGAVPDPGGDSELQELVEQVMSEPLDHGRPLWEDWVVDGLAGGRWALITKVHHSMVDGIAGTDVLTTFFGSSAVDAEPAPSDAAGPVPGSWALVSQALREDAAEASRATRSLVGSLRHPGRLAGATLVAADGLRHFLTAARPVSRSSLVGPLGSGRRYRWAEVPLRDVLEIRTALGCTVNDVVLAAVSLAFRQLLLSRGERPSRHAVRTLVPVSVRRPDERGHVDNRVSAILLDLPVAEEDALVVLEAVVHGMSRLKTSHEPETGELLTELGNAIPPPGLAVGLRTAFRLPQRVLTTVTTNVPGPRVELRLAGRRMVAAYPYVPIADRVRTGIAVTSYGTNLLFGITADFQSTPDIDVLRDGLVDALAALGRAAAEGRTR